MALRFEVDWVLFFSPHCFSYIFPKQKGPMEMRDAHTYFFTLFFENKVGVNWIEAAEGADGGGPEMGVRLGSIQQLFHMAPVEGCLYTDHHEE